MADIFKTVKVTQPVPGGPLQEQLVGAVDTGGSPADAGKVVLLNSSGVLDPSMGGGGGSTAFSAITSGTNATATMTVATGAAVTYTPGGIVNASQLGGTPVSGPATSPGQIPIFDGTNYVPGDPLVQGLFPDGSASKPNPVVTGGWDGTNVRIWKVDSSGNGFITGTVVVSSVTNPVSIAGSVSVTQGTSPWVVSLTSTTITGTVAVTQSTSPWIVAGNATDNTANVTTKVPVIGAVASTSAPTYTNGFMVPLSTDLSGNLRTTTTVTGTFTPALTADRTATGTITSTQNVVVSTAGGGTATFNITGTWTGTIVFEGCIDGTNFFTVDAMPYQFGNLVSSTTANGQWQLNAGGLNQFRVRGNTVATGTATVWIEIGAGSNAGTIMDIVQGSISVNNFPATQTVAGNVTAAQGSANTIANSWPVEVTDGTNVILTNAHPGVVSVSGSVSVNVHDGAGVSILSTTDSGTVGLNVHVTNTGGLAGTQYVEGTSIGTTGTGTLSIAKNPSNIATGLRTDASNNLLTSVNVALPTGTNTIGSVKVTDGTHTAAVTASNQLQTSDAADGTPGLAVPATAIFAAGKDNSTGFLHGLSTDSNGVLNVNASVSGSFTPALTADRTASGTLTTINGAVTISTQGVSGVVFNVVNDTSAWAGTLAFEASPDGTNWYPVNAYAKFPSGAATQTTTVNGQWALPAGGLNSFRVRANTAITGGTGAKVWIEAGAGPLIVEVAQTTAANLNATVAQAAGNWNTNIVQVNGSGISLGQKTMANSFPVVIASDQSSVNTVAQNSSNNIGYVGYQLPTTSRMSFAVINFSSSGNTTVVSGVGGQTIRIWRMVFNVGGATNITFSDGTTTFSGPMSFASDGGFVLDLSGDPWYVTGISNGFVFNSTNAVQVGGTIWYTQS